MTELCSLMFIKMFGLVALLSNGSLFSSEMRTDFFGRICQSCKRFPDDAGDDNDYDFDDDRGQEIFSFTQKEERGRLQIGRMEKVRMR